MNKSTIYKAIVLGALVMCVGAHTANAGYYTPQGVYVNSNNGFTNVVWAPEQTQSSGPLVMASNTYYTNPTAAPQAPVSNTTNNTNTSTTTTNTSTTKAAPAANPTVKHTTVATTKKVVVTKNNDGTVFESLPAVSTANDTTVVSTTDGNDLSALSVRGSGSFMPSSLFQWLLVTLLILAIIIIARMIIRHDSHTDVHVH